jgi:hypothetical protein
MPGYGNPVATRARLVSATISLIGAELDDLGRKTNRRS